jgi:hypothetical protein
MKYFIVLMFTILFAMNGFVQFCEKETINEREEVEIKWQPKSFTYKKGNVNVAVASSILSSISNPLDLFLKSPQVQISADGVTISIIAKGNPLLHLDNQRI